MLSPNQSHVVFDRFGSYRQDVYPPSLVSFLVGVELSYVFGG